MIFKIKRVAKFAPKMTCNNFFGISITAMFGVYLYQNLFPTSKKIENKM